MKKSSATIASKNDEFRLKLISAKKRLLILHWESNSGHIGGNFGF